MGRPMIGDRPLTTRERVARHAASRAARLDRLRNALQHIAQGTAPMAFTQANTEGYTDAELHGFNMELAARLALIEDGPNADWEREQAKKAFNDEVASR